MKENNETKVVCPVCGAEFAIPAHESLSIGVTIAKDSGLGTIYPQVVGQSTPQGTTTVNNTVKTNKNSKMNQKIEALKKAGINVANLFAMTNAEGQETIVSLGTDGKIVNIEDDPVIAKIIKAGTVPNRRLFRRWIMSQVFHMLTATDYNGKTVGFLNALQRKGYCYSWDMLIEELRVQAKLEVADLENFIQRNRWFNKQVAYEMALDYITKVEKHIENISKHPHKCKGVPYITLNGHHIFTADVCSKITRPLHNAANEIHRAGSMSDLYRAVCRFAKLVKCTYSPWQFPMAQAFKNAYKGAGGYFTMRNLIMFHGCVIRTSNGRFTYSQDDSLAVLDRWADEYANDGWKMFGAMKELIANNNINIEQKIAEWRK